MHYSAKRGTAIACRPSVCPSVCHTLKMAAMTSLRPEKCCSLVSENDASARRLCSSSNQYLIYSTFVLHNIVSCRK